MRGGTAKVLIAAQRKMFFGQIYHGLFLPEVKFTSAKSKMYYSQ